MCVLRFMSVSISSVNLNLDSARYPTAVSFSYGELAAYASATLALMRRFGWLSISVINDRLTGSEFALKSGEACKETLNQISKSTPKIDVVEIIQDSNESGWDPAV